VKAIQKRLGVQPVSGYFGEVTHAAVKNFQRKSGIRADGIVGPKTRAKL
jgi:N-acetylmuramoyl-L-alanine amidase